MASILKNDYANRIKIMPSAQGAEIVTAHLVYSILAALVINDVIVLGYLPAGHSMVDAMIDTDDLDSNGTPLITTEGGILNTAETDIDDTKSGEAGGWFGASIIARTGGLDRADVKGIARVPVDFVNNLPIGLHMPAAPATGATTGDIGMTVLYRAAQYKT